MNADESGTFFKTYCPGQYDRLPHKLLMFNNGSVSANIRYRDICSEKFVVNVAFNQETGIFEIVNNSMIDYDHIHVYGVENFIPEVHEIVSKFNENYNITVNWLDCNYTWGWFDYDTGHWTGAVGKVE